MGREQYWTQDPSELLRVEPGFRLADAPTDTSPGFVGGKAEGQAALAEGAIVFAELQERLFANGFVGADQRRVLLVLQAMDTAGKGGIVKHVMGTVDPQGVQFAAFKKPTEEELAHDFLWRVRKRVPHAGMIGVFDRSHYEDVLVARVHQLVSPEEIERRYGAINEFEAELAESGTTIIKVMLHISSEEQKRQLLERLEHREKQWKFDPGDIDERMLLPEYEEAYQIAFDRTATPLAPWYVIPATASGTGGSWCSTWSSRPSRPCSSSGRRRPTTWRPRSNASWRPEVGEAGRVRRGMPPSPPSPSAPQPPNASTIGRNFIMDSASSSAGIESWTMPHPAYAATVPSASTCAQRSAIAHSPSPSPSIQPTGPA